MNKKLAIGITMGIVLILFAILTSLLWLKKSTESKNCINEAEKENAASKDAIEKMRVQNLQTTDIQSEEGKEILSALTYPLGQNNLTFKITAPKNWRTTLEIWNDMKLQYTSFNDNLAVFNFLSPYVPHPKDSGLTPINNLGFFDVTEWMGRDGVGEFEEAQKSSERKEYFNFLIDLRNKKQESDFSKCKSVFRYVCGGYEIKYVESSDGIFSGFASVKFSPQSYEYSPEAYIYMAGKIVNKVVYVKGEFSLYDENKRKIDETLKNKSDVNALVKEALEQFDKNGLPNDSQEQYGEILEVVKSITVDASKRESY